MRAIFSLRSLRLCGEMSLMTWPHFLNIGPAAIAAAISIPALVVLYFLKLRRREMEVSSTLLWKKAIQDLQVNAPFQRLRRNLLLFLQLLLLILLILALARPIANMTPGAGKMTVILIDRSASMNAKDVKGHTRLEEAKKRAKDLVGTLGRDGTAAVIAFDDKAETVHPFSSDAAGLRKAIDDIKPTDRPTKLKLAYQLAEAQSNFNPDQLRANVRPDVWLFSDGKAEDAKDVSIKAELHYEPIGSSSAENVGIVSLSAKRNYQRPTEVEVFVRLANYGPNPVKADVQLAVAPIDPADPSHIQFQSSRIAGTSLVPERWNDVEREKEEKEHGVVNKESAAFKLDLTTAAIIKVEQLHKEGDVLAADDAAMVVVPPPEPLTALLVTDGNWFLEHMINSMTSLHNPRIMTPAAYEAAFDNAKENPAEYHVIMFDAYKPKRIPPAGSFIEFGAVPDGLKLKVDKDQDTEDRVSGVLDWRRDHPILHGLHMNLLNVGQMVRLDVPLESETLVEGTRGPLIVLHREGKQTHLVLAFDIWQSNWPRLQSFPAFMEQAVQFLALGSEMDLRQSYTPGATVRIPRSDLERLDPNIKTISLTGPEGTVKVPIPASGDFALPALDQVGLYAPNPPIQHYEQLAVNLLDSNESDLVPSGNAPGDVGNTVVVKGGKSRVELWWWIVACGALPLLFIEWWVYTRRVHL